MNVLQVIIGVLSFIAASASAVAAWFAYQIAAQTAREAIRPELEVSAWDFTENGDRGVVIVERIKNLGKGPACDVQFAFNPTDSTYPLMEQLLPPVRRKISEIIYPGEEVTVHQTFPIAWEGKPFDDASESRLHIWFWSRAGDRYLIAYQLSSPKSGVILGTPELAPGLHLDRRMVYRPPSFMERLSSWFRELIRKNQNPF